MPKFCLAITPILRSPETPGRGNRKCRSQLDGLYRPKPCDSVGLLYLVHARSQHHHALQQHRIYLGRIQQCKSSTDSMEQLFAGLQASLQEESILLESRFH